MTNLMKRNREMFPAVFGWDAFDKVFEDMRGSLFEVPQGYPTDVVELRNENGDVTSYEVDVALAGIPKENVSISVEKDTLRYVRNSMARRSMQVELGLHGIDKENIKADIVDGLLKVELPIAEEAMPRVIEIG